MYALLFASPWRGDEERVVPGHGAEHFRPLRAIESEPGVTVDAFYPFISDASYVAWRGEPYDEVARSFPSLGHEYRLPCDVLRSLDLDVVNIGPWGRDPHGVHERLYEKYAFVRLPGILEKIVRAVWQA